MQDSHQFWHTKWENNEIRFHQSSIHPALQKFGKKFKPGTILVPLSGKTLDMLYFTNTGHKVIGVELSEIACRDFFKENKLTYKEEKRDAFIVFTSHHITLWCGDFFKLPDSEWQKITGVYDRAAIIALPPDVRKKYADEMTKKLPKDAVTLLITYEYPKEFMQGPPFSVPESEVYQLYGSFSIEKLQAEKEQRQTKDHPTLKNFETVESVYWLKAKLCDVLFWSF